MPSRTPYTERLSPSAGWWFASAGAGVLLGLVAWPLSPAAGYVVAALSGATAATTLWRSSPVISVTGAVLTAGRAHIDVGFLGPARQLTALEMRSALGPELDARAYTCLRSWARTGIRCDVMDPADPTPYWLVSTRHPAALSAAVAAAQHESRQRPLER